MINQNQMRRGRFGRWKPLQAKIRKDAGQPVIFRSKQKIQDGKASALLFRSPLLEVSRQPIGDRQTRPEKKRQHA